MFIKSYGFMTTNPNSPGRFPEKRVTTVETRTAFQLDHDFTLVVELKLC